MECVLADEALDMGGEYDFEQWTVLCDLYGDIDVSDDADVPLDNAAQEAEPVTVLA
jgi:hypothetical protein